MIFEIGLVAFMVKGLASKDIICIRIQSLNRRLSDNYICKIITMVKQQQAKFVDIKAFAMDV
ncbi:hypothetical protein DXX93_16380 [Thalassotalea euphylliae]|uniref:Uncharacterized protein n=1 Tax=Thalassotalea euphylliae TaxID=1655234 RepID=A0A3E0TVP4_9GAMM|nr:hypothetical protein DXX93_16380 [Thalassotalea euphylliae]